MLQRYLYLKIKASKLTLHKICWCNCIQAIQVPYCVKFIKVHLFLKNTKSYWKNVLELGLTNEVYTLLSVATIRPNMGAEPLQRWIPILRTWYSFVDHIPILHQSRTYKSLNKVFSMQLKTSPINPTRKFLMKLQGKKKINFK